MQVGNANFQYALQHLPDLVYPWTTTFHLNVTNATLPGFPRTVPVLQLNDTAIAVRHHFDVETVSSSLLINMPFSTLTVRVSSHPGTGQLDGTEHRLPSRQCTS